MTPFWRLRLSNPSGLKAEKQALRYLKKQGLIPLDRNFACKLGEIDLVMLHNNTLVFIEVRFRSSDHFGSAASTINRQKQQKIRKTAAFYLQKHPKYRFRTCRFDAVTIYNNDSDTKKSLEWIKSAF